jgi:hypothetical protein
VTLFRDVRAVVIGNIGMARPANAINGQMLFDTSARTTPNKAITIAIDQTVIFNHRGTAALRTLVMIQP